MIALLSEQKDGDLLCVWFQWSRFTWIMQFSSAFSTKDEIGTVAWYYFTGIWMPVPVLQCAVSQHQINKQSCVFW